MVAALDHMEVICTGISIGKEINTDDASDRRDFIDHWAFKDIFEVVDFEDIYEVKSFQVASLAPEATSVDEDSLVDVGTEVVVQMEETNRRVMGAALTGAMELTGLVTRLEVSEEITLVVQVVQEVIMVVIMDIMFMMMKTTINQEKW